MPRNKSILEKNILNHEDVVKKPNEEIAPNRIRIIRIANNMDIKYLAFLLNISPSMLQQIETQKKQLTVNILISVSEIFNVSTGYILYQTDEITENKNKELLTDITKLKKFIEGN